MVQVGGRGEYLIECLVRAGGAGRRVVEANISSNIWCGQAGGRGEYLVEYSIWCGQAVGAGEYICLRQSSVCI